MSPDQKADALRTWGFVVGERDPRLNTRYAGRFMVVEEPDYERDHDLPTEDGSNGPWCIVGDDLTALVIEAYDVWAPTYDRGAA